MSRSWRNDTTSYLPILAVLLYPLVFGYHGSFVVSNRLVYFLRVLPTQPIVYAFLLVWWYHKELPLTEQLTRNTWKGLLLGAVFAPVFVLIFARKGFSVGTLSSSSIEWMAKRFHGTPLEEVVDAFSIQLGGFPLLPGASPPTVMRYANMIGEELVCRGIVFQMIYRRTGSIRKATALSSLLFALWHGNYLLIPFYFIWGCSAAGAMVMSGTLATPIVIHIFYNWALDHATFALLNLHHLQCLEWVGRL